MSILAVHKEFGQRFASLFAHALEGEGKTVTNNLFFTSGVTGSIDAALERIKESDSRVIAWVGTRKHTNFNYD